MKKLKSLAFGLLVFLFVAGMSMTACTVKTGDEADDTATEEVEAEATEEEHPTDGDTDEHPSDDADTTATDEEHPSDSDEDEEHPTDEN